MPVAERRDPAIYAPDGWPLGIGDRVTDEDRDRLVAGCGRSPSDITGAMLTARLRALLAHRAEPLES